MRVIMEEITNLNRIWPKRSGVGWGVSLAFTPSPCSKRTQVHDSGRVVLLYDSKRTGGRCPCGEIAFAVCG
jgi:hypothetical protein